MCKGFSEAFRPLCCHSLCVPAHLEDYQLARLLTCAEAHKEDVQHVHLELNALDALSVLLKLTCPSTQLRILSAFPAHNENLYALSALTALKSCSLQSSGSGWLHAAQLWLTPLSCLQHLQSLTLQGPGQYSCVEAARHLTKLVVLDGCVVSTSIWTPICEFAENLQVLIVQHADVTLRIRGIEHLRQLRRLHVLDSVLFPALSTDADNTMLPTAASWSALVHLESLHLHIRQSPAMIRHIGTYAKYVNGDLVDLSWVTALTSLRSLVLDVNFPCAVPAIMPGLSQLSKLWLCFTSEWLSQAMVDWPHNCCLQDVYLGHGSFLFDDRLLGLALVTKLCRVKLELTPEGATAQQCHAKLRECFAHHAPNVHFSLS